MTSQLEKRVFILFFVITFVMIFLLILISWQIIAFSIRQNEDREIKDRFTKIETSIKNYSQNRNHMLSEISNHQELQQAFLLNDSLKIRQLFDSLRTPEQRGIFYLYDEQGEKIYGDRFPIAELQINRIFETAAFAYDSFLPIAVGREIFMLFVKKTVIPADHSDLIYYLFHLEQFDNSLVRLPSDLQAFFFTNPENLGNINLPDNYKQSSHQLQAAVNRAVDNTGKSHFIRLSLELGGAVLIYEDIFNHPAMIVFSPYYRNLNQFAHQGLLFVFLILTGIALLMITLSANWFKGKIIAPVKEVSHKMKTIASNPTTIMPPGKKYSGILGDMIDTFYNMNNALHNYGNSLMVYKTITDHLDSGILWMDADMKIIICNPSILTIFDYTNITEVIGLRLDELLNVDQHIIDDAKSQGVYNPRLEIKIGKASKFVRFVVFSVKQTNDKSGIRHIASIYDITTEIKEAAARERLEFELIKSNRLAELGRLAEGIVHNINSPLNNIVGYAQLIKKNYPENKDIEKILSVGSSIAASVKKLLSKVREDNISMIRPIDINNLITLELDMCRHNIFFSQNIKLKTDLAPRSLMTDASHGDISICIANIINNAIYAMQETDKKELSVATAKKHSRIIIKIADTGTGIDPRYINKIFNPDFTTKNVDSAGGYGLGLAISKSIIEKYNGKIEVQSELGSGSSFTIYLPYSSTAT